MLVGHTFCLSDTYHGHFLGAARTQPVTSVSAALSVAASKFDCVAFLETVFDWKTYLEKHLNK